MSISASFAAGQLQPQTTIVIANSDSALIHRRFNMLLILRARMVTPNRGGARLDAD